MRIAVVGAGSSGLITCKYLREVYPAGDIVCLEKGTSVRGCWGDQRADFVSTSTKYTTQFSCFRRWSAEPAPVPNFEEFYRGAEFGDYLEAFAKRFDLLPGIRFQTTLTRLERIGDRWRLHLSSGVEHTSEDFDAVFLCTGLVNQKVPLNSGPVRVVDDPSEVRDQTVVVVGGGETATDIANQLAQPEHGNTVYLSLRSGVWVSPRYHPIRGVPSDFLRNRLMLSFDKSLRNRIGERFVTFRMRFPGLLSRLFPGRSIGRPSLSVAQRRQRSDWDLRLKARARGPLFDTFHNKGDDFLDTVAQGRLRIIGPPTDESWQEFFDFDRQRVSQIIPDVLIPAVGYRSRLGELSGGEFSMADFHHGCVHADPGSDSGSSNQTSSGLFLIGFARPVIGNIPSISEVQARYAIGVLSSAWTIPAQLTTASTDGPYVVEQFGYCDALAQEMDVLPSLAKLRSVRLWLRILLVPASTTHYVDEFFDPSNVAQQRVFMPPVLVAIMLALRTVSLPLRGWRRLRIMLARGATPPSR